MRVFAVLPAYNEEKHIAGVIAAIPAFIDRIVVVDDASTDATATVVEGLRDPRVVLLRERTNQGVGGAMLDGYRRALELGCDVAVKVDADGQMDPGRIQSLVAPIAAGDADYTKGFRYHDPETLRRMPKVRLWGNVGLSFLTKIASGYWNIFDPTNGFTAIHRVALERIEFTRIHRDYFFETDMLANLYRMGAVVRDVYLPTYYGDETSHMSAVRTILTFPGRLFRLLLRRIAWRYFIADFSAVSLLLIVGGAMFTFGLVFGLWTWIHNATRGVATPTGTVMLAAVPFILGFQMLLQALVIDVANVPQIPLQNQRDQPGGRENRFSAGQSDPRESSMPDPAATSDPARPLSERIPSPAPPDGTPEKPIRT
jgi:glycosyltransferase involved in cell wall biosynthesis